jgi:hypothetical protein
MLQIKPTSLSVHESAPGTVAKYRVRAHQVGSGTIIREAEFNADGQADQAIPLGSTFFHPEDIGKTVFLGVVEIGPDGTESPETTEMNADGVGNKTHAISAEPDGAESVTVTE